MVDFIFEFLASCLEHVLSYLRWRYIVIIALLVALIIAVALL